MATKQQQKAFNKKVTAFLMESGAVFTDGQFYPYKLSTICGTLGISLDKPDGSSVYSIFCCFEDVKKASGVMGINEHSGKWNWHGGQEIFEEFKTALTPLLIKANGMTYKGILLPNKDYKVILNFAPDCDARFRLNYSGISGTYTGLVCESYTDSIRGLLRLWPTFFDDIDDDYRKTFEKMGISKVEATEKEVRLHTALNS